MACLRGRPPGCSRPPRCSPYALASFAAQWVGLVPPASEEVSSRSRLGSEEGKGGPEELASEPEERSRTGACHLAWEQETEELVKRWLAERLAAPSRAGAMSQWGTGGSRKKEEKARRLRGSFRARSDDDQGPTSQDPSPRGAPPGDPDAGGRLGLTARPQLLRGNHHGRT